ncbi:MAG: hypothetical protein ACRDY3_13230 [Acidimicrobiales bacterium]
MLISYVVRLRPDALAGGRFVGEIEAVATRQRAFVRSLDQVAGFILQTVPAEGPATAPGAGRTLAGAPPAPGGDADRLAGGERT